MATPISPGTWDPGPVHPGVRLGVSVAAGGSASSRLGELRRRATVDTGAAIRAEGAAAVSASTGASGRGRHLPGPGFPGVTTGPRIDVTAQRQAADGNVALRPNQKPGSDRFSAPEPEQENLR